MFSIIFQNILGKMPVFSIHKLDLRLIYHKHLTG
jgi:hypothetical protein